MLVGLSIFSVSTRRGSYVERGSARSASPLVLRFLLLTFLVYAVIAAQTAFAWDRCSAYGNVVPSAVTPQAVCDAVWTPGVSVFDGIYSVTPTGIGFYCWLIPNQQLRSGYSCDRITACPISTTLNQVSGSCDCPAGRVFDKVNQVCFQPGGAGINFGAPAGPLTPPAAPPESSPSTPENSDKDGQGGGNSCNSPNVGDPINVAAGNLIETEVDYANKFGGSMPLRIERTYNSLSGGRGLFGSGWSSNLDSQASLNAGGSILTIKLADGKLIAFTKSGNTWSTLSALSATLTSNASGYLLVTYDKHSYQFDTSGRLTAFANATGEQQTYQYTGSQLTSITDNVGNTVTISYNGMGFVSSVTVADQLIQYSYNTASSDPAFGNLLSITRPASNGPGTVTRQYLYENTQFPWALTGLIDESGNRVATWGYNTLGLASSNNRAGSENFTIDYTHIADVGDPYSLVTNTTGYQWRYHLQTGSDGLVQVTRIEGLGSANCPAASSYTSYDTGGRTITTTDGNGNVTLRHYAASGLADQVIEGYRWSSTPTGNVADLVEAATMRKQVVTAWDTTNTWPTQLVYSGKDLSGVWLQYQREDRSIDTHGRLQSKTLTDLTSLSDPYTSDFQTRQWLYTYTYFDAGQTKLQTMTVQDPRGNTVTSTYDTSGRKVQVSQPVNATLIFTTTYGNFNAAGLPQLITDINGIPAQASYDTRNRLRQLVRNVGDASAQTTTFDYYESGNLKRVTLGDGGWLNYTYGDGVHLSRLDDSGGNYVLLTPSSLDGQWTQRRVFDSSGSLQQTQNRVFDDLGRLLQLLDASNTTIKSSYSYDGSSHLLSSEVGTDATTAIVRSYDALQRLKQLDTPDGNHSQYQYDAQGNLAKITDPRGLVTQYTFDGLGNRMKLDSPDSGVTKFWYDAAGNAIEKIDARGIEVHYAYDALNRLTGITYPASPAENVSYVYDYADFENSKGHLSYINDNDGYVVMGYDAYGNIGLKADWISTVSSESDHAYNKANRVIGITYPSGRVVTYTRNSLGQITQVQMQDNASASPQPLITSATYKPFGPLASLSFYNGVNTTLTYDADYRIGRITATSTPNWDYSYGYDAADNINLLTDEVGSNDRSYIYDKLNRITQDNKPSAGSLAIVAYQYDANSNRTLWKQGTNPVLNFTQTYPAISNIESQYGSTVLLHDNAGNITAFGSKTFTYDSANRMSMSVVGSTTTIYRYNGLGQRTTKLSTTGGVTITTHYDYDPAGNYIAQTQLNADGTYAKSDEYIWLDDTPIAQVHTVYGTNNAVASEQLLYIHADHLNTPRAMTDATKKVVWKWESEAYGRAAPNTDPDLDGVQAKLDLRFPGQIADAETGFYYNWNRYYDSLSGRYMQSDPIGLRGGFNLYAYVSGNPVSRIDPLGLDWVYHQGSGQLQHVDGNGDVTDAGSGYSGHGAGINNPAMQNVPNTGPIPQGTYDIQPQQDNTTGAGTNLPGSMRLTPQDGTDTSGRDGFLIHGDNSRGDQSASHGCVILNRNTRNQIGGSGDNTLKVVP